VKYPAQNVIKLGVASLMDRKGTEYEYDQYGYATGRKGWPQFKRLSNKGLYVGRDALNFGNSKTVEVRAFRSTRNADDLRAAVRLVYYTADYVRHLMDEGQVSNPARLNWTQFTLWVATNHPEGFASIANLSDK